MPDPDPPQRVATTPGSPKLNHTQLLIAQQETLDMPRRSYGLASRVFYWLPQILSFAYYQLSWFLFVLRPNWSYLLNADFEDHAEHEYMEFVAEHPEWEQSQFKSAFADDYGHFDSLADLFRQIGHDERVRRAGKPEPAQTASGSPDTSWLPYAVAVEGAAA